MKTFLKSVLVLAAMKEEEESLSALLGPENGVLRTFGRRLCVEAREFKIGPRQILVARSGIGPVNAALTVAAIFENHPLDSVILLGVGGALTPELELGDLVVSRQVLQHDSLFSLDAAAVRVIPGELLVPGKQIPALPPLMDADPALVDLIVEGLPADKAKIGTVVSGNEFVGTVRRKRELHALHPEALLVDMEAAGVAQLARRLKLPFVVVKTVADRLHVDGTIEADFWACLHAAAANAAQVLHQLLGR